MNIVEGTFCGLAGQEIELFQNLLRDLPGEAVEIGSLDGFSSVVILDSSRLNLTCIDPFIPDSMEPSLIGHIDLFRKNVAPYDGRWTLLKAFSNDVVSKWTTPLDLLFLDGDHAQAAVQRDFDQWTPLLKTGGLLAMHDSRMSRPGGATFHPGPSRVAAEQVYGKPDKWEIVGEAFSLTMAKKR